MAKNPGPKTAQPSKRCIFCNDPGVTEEHIFPQWLGRMVKRSPTDDHRTTGTQPSESDFGKLPPIRTKQGKALNTVIRAACHDCNTTWMSRIEDETKPVLLPLMRGRPSRLSFANRMQIATWLTLKAMVIDAGRDIPRDQRTPFYKKPSPKDRWHIFLGQSEMKFGECGFTGSIGPTFLYNRKTGERLAPIVENPDDPDTVVILIFSGHFVGVAVYCPFSHSQLIYWKRPGQDALQPLWPFNALAVGLTDWPPEYMITLGGMVSLPEAMLTGGVWTPINPKAS